MAKKPSALTAQPAYWEAMQATTGWLTETVTPGSQVSPKGNWQNSTVPSPPRQTSGEHEAGLQRARYGDPSIHDSGAVVQSGHRHVQSIRILHHFLARWP